MANSFIRPPASIHDEYKPPRRRSSLSGPVTFAIVIIAIIFVMSVLLRVAVIEVVGNTHYTSAEIIKAIDIEEGDNLFFFDRFAAISRVFAKLPYVEEVSVTRKLPNKVIIEIAECKALAVLSLGDEEWTLDHNCKVLGKAAEGEMSELIMIYGVDPGTLMIGEQLETADNDRELVDYIAEVLNQIQDRGMSADVVSADFADKNNASFIYRNGKYTVELGGYDNIEYKFGMVVSVISQLKSGDVGIIDVSDGATARFTPT